MATRLPPPRPRHNIPIVTTRPRRKRTKAARAAAIKVPTIVQHLARVRAWKLSEPDPEAEVRAAAFFARMIRPGS